MTSRFGCRIRDWNEEREPGAYYNWNVNPHTGIDLGLNGGNGDYIAITNGTMILHYDGARGLGVKLTSGNEHFWYYHMNSSGLEKFVERVKNNLSFTVSAGDVIGGTGPGCSPLYEKGDSKYPPHLHFEYTRGGSNPLDPAGLHFYQALIGNQDDSSRYFSGYEYKWDYSNPNLLKNVYKKGKDCFIKFVRLHIIRGHINVFYQQF